MGWALAGNPTDQIYGSSAGEVDGTPSRPVLHGAAEFYGLNSWTLALLPPFTQYVTREVVVSESDAIGRRFIDPEKARAHVFPVTFTVQIHATVQMNGLGEVLTIHVHEDGSALLSDEQDPETEKNKLLKAVGPQLTTMVLNQALFNAMPKTDAEAQTKMIGDVLGVPPSQVKVN